MKTKLFLIIGIILMLFFACKNPKPKGTEFAWSPDGKYLAMVQINSHELLLIETAGQEVKQITRIDTMAEAPQWSHDGRYLLYCKKNETAKTLEVLTFSMSTKRSAILLNTREVVFKGDYTTFWSPAANDIEYLSQTGNGGYAINSVSAEGKNKKVLFRSKSEPLHIQWSMDGRWLYFVLNETKDIEESGIWAIHVDDKHQKQVLKTKKITALQQSPDGRFWAYIKKCGEEDTYNQLVITDNEFKPVHTFYRISHQLSHIDWSPDSKQIICVEKGNEYQNLWLAGFDSKALLKFTYDNLDRYFGWHDRTHFTYTVYYPEEIVPLTKKDEDDREMMKMLYGQIQLNQYFVSDNRDRKHIGDNIFADTYSAGNDKRAYYVAYKREMDLLDDDERYIPVIKFSQGDLQYVIRTPDEEAKMMHLYYRNGDYRRAKESMVRYWNMKYQIEDIADFSNFQDKIERRKIDRDKSDNEILKEEFNILLSMVLVHRKLGEVEVAEQLFSQIGGLVEEDKSWENLHDFFFFLLMSTYVKYDAMEEGIHDIDMMMSLRPADSLYIADLYVAQSFLLDVSQDRKGMLEKLHRGIAYLPVYVEEKRLLNLGFIAERYKEDLDVVSAILPLADRLLQQADIDDEVSKLLAEMYLTSGDREKAYVAYQKAVTAGFDSHQLWQKLIDLKLGMGQ